jgi:hypothetical protein
VSFCDDLNRREPRVPGDQKNGLQLVGVFVATFILAVERGILFALDITDVVITF